MDDDNSDVEAVETEMPSKQKEIFDESESRPIMLVFKQLVSNDNSKSIVLSNDQMIEILRKEFNFNTTVMTELEVEIYLNVMKKYLKEWPKWDDFQRVMHRLKGLQYHDLLKSNLERKYKLLKKYLNKMLQITKPLAAEAVKEYQDTIEANTVSVQEEEGENDVIMEVLCTREQLNQLFYRHPKGDLSTNIFNAASPVQNRIILNAWELRSILNMWNVKVMINLNCLIYKREIKHELKHVLVNKKHGSNPQYKLLNMTIQEKCKKSKEFNQQALISVLDSIWRQFADELKITTILHIVFTIIKMDLEFAPDILKLPARYRQYMNQYPYVRYLYAKDNDGSTSSDTEKYDLQLEEMIYPMVEYQIGKLESQCYNFPEFSEWFQIECGYCIEKFSGLNLVEQLKAHFDDKHHSEPDWECVNCKKKFEMRLITELRWNHICQK